MWLVRSRFGTVRRANSFFETPGKELHWSKTGHSFIYGIFDPDDPDERVFELRVRDLDSGTEQAIDGTGVGAWSPDGRYLLLDDNEYHGEGDEYGFRVYDLVEQRDAMTLAGAWPGSWLDDTTLGFTGNVCDTYDFYTINVDGSDLRKVIEFDRPFVIGHPSRQGDRVAYSVRDDSGNVTTTVLRLATGETRTYDTGRAQLRTLPGDRSHQWSPDGSYLVVSIPPGKGGPCEFDPPQSLAVEVH